MHGVTDSPGRTARQKHAARNLSASILDAANLHNDLRIIAIT